MASPPAIPSLFFILACITIYILIAYFLNLPSPPWYVLVVFGILASVLVFLVFRRPGYDSIKTEESKLYQKVKAYYDNVNFVRDLEERGKNARENRMNKRDKRVFADDIVRESIRV